MNDALSWDEERVVIRVMLRDERGSVSLDGIGTSLCEREWGRDCAGDEPPRVIGCSKDAARRLDFWGVVGCGWERGVSRIRLPDGIGTVENASLSGIIFDGLSGGLSLTLTGVLPLATVTSPTPTFFSHHPITPPPATPEGHLYTLNAVPCSSHKTLRHFLSLA